MFIQQIALVSLSKKVGLSDTTVLAAALQKQATRDVAPIWGIQATVDAFGTSRDVPPGYWPIFIRDDIGFAGAAGIHLDDRHQPFALVDADEEIPLVCSHEMIEMLVDPFGNRLVASDSIKPGQGRVHYLVEPCDPSEASELGYPVNGLLLSDFYTPRYFDPVASPAVRYSFTGAITRPKQVLRGGYLSWIEPVTGQWWQAEFFGTSLRMGPINVRQRPGESWRESVDAQSFALRKKRRGVSPGRSAATRTALTRGAGTAASLAWCAPGVTEASLAGATGWDRCIARLLESAAGH